MHLFAILGQITRWIGAAAIGLEQWCAALRQRHISRPQEEMLPADLHAEARARLGVRIPTVRRASTLFYFVCAC